jgi:hypothetical protein
MNHLQVRRCAFSCVKKLLSHLPFLLVVSLALSSCDGPIVQQQVPFVEADFAPVRCAGSGAVAGRAFVVMESGTVRFPIHSEMYAVPVNAYTTEIVTRKYARGENLAPPDPRYAQYARTVLTDYWGNFEIRNLPSGEYYVGTTIRWTSTSTNAEDGTVATIFHSIPIYTRVSLHGQTVVIANWTFGHLRVR